MKKYPTFKVDEEVFYHNLGECYKVKVLNNTSSKEEGQYRLEVLEVLLRGSASATTNVGDLIDYDMGKKTNKLENLSRHPSINPNCGGSYCK
jgi:hypothetical protein